MTNNSDNKLQPTQKVINIIGLAVGLVLVWLFFGDSFINDSHHAVRKNLFYVFFNEIVGLNNEPSRTVTANMLWLSLPIVWFARAYVGGFIVFILKLFYKKV